MAARNAEQSAGMGNEGKDVRDRRLRLGMTIDDLANEAGVSPDTLGDFEAGNRRPRELTVSKVLGALDRIEEEVGLHAPPPEPAASESGLVTFRLSGQFGVDVVVQGPVSNVAELESSVERLIRALKERTEES